MLENALKRMMLHWFVLAAVLSGVLMVGIMTAAFADLFRATAMLLQAGFDRGQAGSAEVAIRLALTGLELLFLSPLAFLVVLAIAHDLRDFLSADKHARVGRSMAAVESLVISLLIAVIATEMIERLVSHSGPPLSEATGSALIMLVLVAYLVVRESLHRRHEKA